jgi:hypothetical protein
MEVDGSMAPLEELDDSTKGLEGWRKAGLLWNGSIPISNTKGLYLYPCPNTTLVDYKHNIHCLN